MVFTEVNDENINIRLDQEKCGLPTTTTIIIPRFVVPAQCDSVVLYCDCDNVTCVRRYQIMGSLYLVIYCGCPLTPKEKIK